MYRYHLIIILLVCFSYGMLLPLNAQEHDDGGFTIEATVPVESELAIEPEEPVESGIIIKRRDPEPGGDDFVIEEEILDTLKFREEPVEEDEKPGQFITDEMLNPVIVEPAVKYYIHSDINRKGDTMKPFHFSD